MYQLQSPKPKEFCITKPYFARKNIRLKFRYVMLSDGLNDYLQHELQVEMFLTMYLVFDMKKKSKRYT